jgi:hypothetical protein
LQSNFTFQLQRFLIAIRNRPCMQPIDYVYAQRGRRPATLAAVAAGCAFLGYGVANGADWFWMAVVGSACLMSLAEVVADRKTGMSVSGDQVTMFSGTWSEAVPTTRIAAVIVKECSESASTITLILKRGPLVRVPAYCFGSEGDLLDALASRRIRIDRS